MPATQPNLTNLYQRQKLSLAEIMDKIVEIDDNSIDITQARYEHSQELITIVNAASLPQSDKFTITCAKSGAFIRFIDINEFALLEKIHGNKRAMEILELRSTTHIAAHWLYTDGKALEKLAEHDPHGYFIYAVDKVLRATQEIFHNFARIDDSHQKMAIEYKWHRSKHLAWKLIQKQPVNKIIKCNELMRRYLSIIDTSTARHIVKFTTTNILEIAEFGLLNFINDLQSAIREILNWAWKNNRIRRDLTIDDVLKLKNLFKGHSNFAQQRKVENQSNLERIVEELEDFFEPELMRRLHMPKVSNEDVKEMQTGRTKIVIAQKGFVFNFAAKK